MSQDVFQQKMSMIIEKWTGALALIDDVIIHRKTKQEHDQNLPKLMETVRTAGLTFNSDKCAVNQNQVKFFGAIFDENEIRPDPEKVEEIKSLSSPTNVTEVQQVLGIITYMVPFIPRFSDLIVNLRELLKKDTSNKWCDSHQKSLQEIKDLMCKEMLLQYYYPSKKFIIQVVISSRRAALIQEDKLVAFTSKSQIKTKQYYANIKRELLAVVLENNFKRTFTDVHSRSKATTNL